MPTTSILTPCGSACSVDEQAQAVETNASLSGYDGCGDVSDTITSDPGRSTCKDDVNMEDSEMKLKRQQQTMLAGEDEDEYTLCAFGDISLSNINFVPGPPAALSPEKKANKSVSATSRSFKQHLPKVIRKVLPPPSPSKAFVSSVEMDFEAINNNLKRSRDKIKPQPPPVTSRKPIVDRDEILYSPQPRRLIDLQNFGIDMVIRSHDTMECKLVSSASAGKLRANGKHALWDSNMAQGIGYHLGLGPACLKLT